MNTDHRNLPPKYRQKAPDLTPQRVLVLKQLVLFEEANAHPPSVRELTELLKLRSPSTVQSHLESLERQGLVEHRPRAARGWRATRSGPPLGPIGFRAA